VSRRTSGFTLIELLVVITGDRDLAGSWDDGVPKCRRREGLRCTRPDRCCSPSRSTVSPRQRFLSGTTQGLTALREKPSASRRKKLARPVSPQIPSRSTRGDDRTPTVSGRCERRELTCSHSVATVTGGTGEDADVTLWGRLPRAKTMSALSYRAAARRRDRHGAVSGQHVSLCHPRGSEAMLLPAGA